MKKLKGHCLSLSEEAQLLHPLIAECWAAYDAGLMLGHDVVGVYILSYLSLRQPNRWISSLLKVSIAKQLLYSDPIHSETVTSIGTSLSVGYSSIRIADVPSFVDRLGGWKYLRKKLFPSHSLAKELDPALVEVRVVDVFNLATFTGIKHNVDNSVNKTLVGWALGIRPVRLLSFIPSPMQVLRQQAAGERVVTAFRELQDLSRSHVSQLTYMSNGSQSHERDPLAFLLHDFSHMELFISVDSYAEQVGFFSSILQLGGGHPRQYFKENLPRAVADSILWQELEYVISDMNCYSTHLMRYLFAKINAAWNRSLNTERTHGVAGNDSNQLPFVESFWAVLLNDLGLQHVGDGAGYEAGMMLLEVAARSMTPDHWLSFHGAALRDSFTEIGLAALDKEGRVGLTSALRLCCVERNDG